MALLDFAREGDTVMICKHLFEHARRGDLPWIPLSELPREGRFVPPQRFRRDDGTEGACDFVVYCRACSFDRKNVDLVEEVVRGGLLHVADFMTRRAH